jgi:hypothetical protein
MRAYLSHLTKTADFMMAAELYQKTLVGYEASLGKGESVSLSRYCKIHHINNRGLRYWMKKHSIDPPRHKSRKIAAQSCINNISHSITSPGHMVPLLIQSPSGEKAKKSTRSNSSLKGVSITTPTGLDVHIPEISCLDLAELILSCNTR